MTSTILAKLHIGSFRWDAIAPGRASRVAAGVLLPLIVGWASGQIEYGAFAALGALPTGFASFQGVTRSRIEAVAVAGLGMAVSTFVGAVAAATLPSSLILIVLVWGYVTGLAVALGPRYSVAILQWSVGLLIAVGLPQGPAEAALRAGLVLVGGLLQALLVAGSWMIHRGEPERAALAKSYQSLADYASDLAAARLTPPLPIAFPASSALDDANPFLAAPERLTLLDLLEQAERLRASLAAMAAEAAIRESDDKKDIQKLASETATVLNLMADALRVGRAERPNRVRDVISRVARLKVVAQAPWRWAGEALLGQLRAVARILAQFDGMPAQPSARHRESDSAVSPSEVGFIAALATLRANVTLATEAGRHAVRLAIVAGLAEAIVQGTGLSQGRWVVLTIFLVLKPDYNSTLSRSFHRAMGTALGAGLGAAAAYLGHLGQGVLIAAGGVGVAAAYALFDVNYLLFSIFLTEFIVVLLDILGIPAIRTAEARVIDTAIGAAMALIAAVRRLAHAELALHALIIVRQRRAGQVELTVAQQVNAFTAALDTALSRLIVSLKTLQPPQPTPALRPLQIGLRDKASVGDEFVGVTDALIDAVDTLSAILRDRVAWPKQA